MDSMKIRSTVISHSRPDIPGQMSLIALALDALRRDISVPPLDQLKPGHLHKRIEDHLRGQGFDRSERPSRSTFDRFRKQFGAKFGIR